MRTLLFIFVCLLTVSPLRAEDLKVFDHADYVEHQSNDGDSFMMKLDRKTYMLRLYYVDCPETTLGSGADRRRVLEQARYFGVGDAKSVIDAGKAAAHRTRELLLNQNGRVYTAFAHAMGRSGKPRYYAMIELPDGRDLAAVLIQEGLARNKGVRRLRPDQTSSDEYGERLADAELAAALSRKGLWKVSDPEKLAEMRQAQRQEEALLEGYAFGVFNTVTKDNPLNLNTATEEELQSLKGVGEVLAGRIVQHRPFLSKEDLLKVDGIGPSLLKQMYDLITIIPVPQLD